MTLYFQHKEKAEWNLQYARQDNQEGMMTLHSKLWQKKNINQMVLGEGEKQALWLHHTNLKTKN